MPGALNKANARRNIKTKARSNRAAKERRTLELKKNRLERHLKAHAKDRTAKTALAFLKDGRNKMRLHHPVAPAFYSAQKTLQASNA